MIASPWSPVARPLALRRAREEPTTYGGLALPEPQPTTPDPSPAPDPPLSEALLARLWAGQRFPESALVTSDGVPLRILHPGLPGRGAGPDFRDAIIAAPDSLLRGDVELHQRSSDFRAHGHHRDPRYNRLVLHVVFVDDAAAATCVRGGATRVPVVSLAAWLERRTRELSGWLASPSLWREPCHDAIARLGAERVRGVLVALGNQRFAERTALFRAALDADDPGQVLYRALLSAVSYGGDQTFLERVADTLPLSALSSALAAAPEAERPATAEALLLGAAGLDQPNARSLATGAIRPANHPARRLAGLAALILRHQRLFADSTALRLALEAPVAQLVASWSVPASGYWGDHVAPGVPSRGRAGALVGRGRAIELLVNAVLPWTAALAEHNCDHELAAAAQAAFTRLPSPGRYGRLGFLEANLGLGTNGRRLDAPTQQGLLALYKTECTQGGCGRCPLS